MVFYIAMSVEKKDFQSKLMLAGIQYGWATALRKLVNVAHGDIICRDQLFEDNRLTGVTEGFLWASIFSHLCAEFTWKSSIYLRLICVETFYFLLSFSPLILCFQVPNLKLSFYCICFISALLCVRQSYSAPQMHFKNSLLLSDHRTN